MKHKTYQPKRLGHVLYLFTLMLVVQVAVANNSGFLYDPGNFFQTNDIVVRGTVYDPANRPVEGASINVKGVAGKGTTTNAAGEFTITVQQGNVLLISYVGHETREVTVTNDNPVSIVLVASDQSLNA